VERDLTRVNLERTTASPAGYTPRVKLKDALNMLIFGVCVGGSVAAAYNVMGDNAEVRGRADELACSAKSPCRPVLLSEERTPISQSFGYTVAEKSEVSVRCARSFYLVGAYSCAVQAE
jgi:hypothetical protein